MELLTVYDAVATAIDLASEARDVYSGIQARTALGQNGAQDRHLYLVGVPNPALEWTSGFCINCYCGKKLVRKTLDKGTFLCPICEEEEPYKHKAISLRCHYFQIPLCLDHQFDDYIKCAKCGIHFQVDILDWEHSEAKKALDSAILHAMIRIVAARGGNAPVMDGHVNSKSVDVIREIYESTAGIKIKTDEILAQVNECAENRCSEHGSIVTDLHDFSLFLNADQKDIIIRSMILVAIADGELEEEQAKLLVQAGKVLDVENKHVKEILQVEYEHKRAMTKTTAVEEKTIGKASSHQHELTMKTTAVAEKTAGKATLNYPIPKCNPHKMGVIQESKVHPVSPSGLDPTQEIHQASDTRELVKQYMVCIWNRGDLGLISKVCACGVQFKYPDGTDGVGRDGLRQAVQTIRGSFQDFHCELHSMAVEKSMAFCRTRITGRHTGRFLGYEATGKNVSWDGASEFTVKDGMIVKIWDLEDMASLEHQLIEASQDNDPADEWY
jgi:predicted ester cyclase/uncharacterized tellurite resistance protein B-like protein